MALTNAFARALLSNIRSCCSCLGNSSIVGHRAALQQLRAGTGALQASPARGLSRSVTAALRTVAAPTRDGTPLRGAPLNTAADQRVLPDESVQRQRDNDATLEVIERVNQQIAERGTGRLFAVVHVGGRQFRVTDGDLIVVQGHWPPQLGETILLQKVLLVGSRDFSLVGRPVLEPGQASVQATVIEKALSHTKTIFRTTKRSKYKRINFCRVPLTTVRINYVRLERELDAE